MIAHPGVDHSSWTAKSGSTRQEEYNTYSEMADSHTYATKRKQNHDKKTGHGTAADFFFCRLKIHLSSIYFSPRNFYCIQESPLQNILIVLVLYTC